jgi:hypothetical protein
VTVIGLPFHWQGIEVLIARCLHAERIITRRESLNLERAIAARFCVLGERRWRFSNRHYQRAGNRLLRVRIQNRAVDTGSARLATRSRDREQ